MIWVVLSYIDCFVTERHYKIYHLIYIFYFIRIKVKIGATRRYQLSGFQEMDVVKIIRHEHYSPEPRFYNDIALLKLEKRIKMGKFYFINLKNSRNIHTHIIFKPV